MSDRLEDLGIDRRCFEYLRSLGLLSVPDLLESDPSVIARRPAFAGQIATAVQRQFPDQSAFCAAILRPHPGNGGPAPATPLEHALAILRRRGEEPMTYRRLREEVLEASAVRNLVTLRRELEGHPEVIFYPFGAHDWVGLRAAGQAGIRAAARAAWLLLPLHLESLVRQGRTGEVGSEILAVLQEMTEERNHRDLLRLLPLWERPPEPAPAPMPVRVQEPERPYRVGLLQGLDFGQSIERLAGPVAQALEALPGPRSLCQLRATQGDLEWLRGWAASLNPQHASQWLEGVNPCFLAGNRIVSLRECFGLLFMLLACEVCRRESSVGHVWTEICPCFSPRSRPVLFSQGHARAPLAQALEAACRRFHLHHAFGLEGVQAWYQSFYLQFGFPRSGILQLPGWLSVEESQSVAIRALRGQSSEFTALWEALRQHRDQRNPQSRERLRRILEENSYALPEWREDLMRAALEAVPESNYRETGEEVAYPLLRWPVGGHPLFVLSPTRSFTDLVDPAYTLYQDEEPIARLFLEPEGYVSDPGEVSFRPQHDRMHLTLAGDGQEDVRELELELWDSEALYCVYHLSTGERLETPAPGQPCALLLAEGVTLEPPAPHAVPCGRTGFRLHQLPAGLTMQHRLMADGQELASLAEPRTPDWAGQLRLAFRQTEPARLPCRLTFDLMGPSGVTVRWARFGRQTIPMREVPGVGWRGQVMLEPDLASPRIRMHFGVERGGQRARISCSEIARLVGVTAWLDGVWRVLDRRPRLAVSEGREGSFRFFIPENNHSQFGLVEGDVFSARPRAGTRSLGRLAGFGSELRLCPGPYNSPAEGDLLAAEVVDHGLVQEIRQENGAFQLDLHRRVDGDEAHFLLWWDGHGQPVLQAASELTETEGSCWNGPLPNAAPAPCVAFGYEGVRLGCWWEDQLSLPESTDTPARMAGLLRWLHLPLLRSRWRQNVRRMARCNPVEFLESWLVSDSVADCPRLRYEAELSEWFTVVREIFEDWDPGEDTVQARRVVNRISTESLLRVSPLLMVRVARAAWNDERLKELRLELVGCPAPRLEQELQSLEATAARDMGVQEPNVRRLIRDVQRGNPLNRREQLNLGLAMGVAPFRRALAARLLT